MQHSSSSSAPAGGRLQMLVCARRSCGLPRAQLLSTTSVATSALWGHLVPGPAAVGFGSAGGVLITCLCAPDELWVAEGLMRRLVTLLNPQH